MHEKVSDTVQVEQDSAAHLVVRMTPPDYTAHCLHCDSMRLIRMPMPMDSFFQALKDFESDHADCLAAGETDATATV